MDGIIMTSLIGLGLGAQYALLSLGFTLVFGILGVINFAHGGFYLIGGYTAYTLAELLGLPYPVAVLAATLFTGFLGYIVEYFLIEPYVDKHLTTMLITLGLYLVIITALTVIFGPEPSAFSFPVKGVWRGPGFYMPYSNMIVIGIGIGVVISLYLFLYKTNFGLGLRAMADDRVVAIAHGMRPAHLFPIAFAIATGLAGLTGALVTPILSLNPHAGEAVLATSFMIVILGGLGSVTGALVASFIVGIVEAFSSVYLGSSQGSLVLFLLVVLILVMRPTGLLGREVRQA